MNAIQKTLCASLVLTSIVCGPPLWADDGERDLALEINKANELLRGGDVDAAIGVYQLVKERAPENFELSYNTAVAQYRKGDVTAAEQLFQATAASENDAIAAKARYNLGNCNYASALQQAEKDRPAAIRELESAIANYRSALDIDGADADARANIELAAQLIDKLRADHKQQEEQQKQQQQDQQQQEQQQEQSKDQQQQEQQNEQQQGGESQQQPQDKEQQQQSQSSQGENEDDQSAEKKQSAEDKPQSNDEQSKEKQSEPEQTKQEQSKSQPQNSKDAAQQEPQQSRAQSEPNRQQQSAGEQPEQNSPPSAEHLGDEQVKQPPQGELTSSGDMVEKPDQQDKQNAAAFDPSKDGEMTAQEAEKMLQAIRDRDMIRRLRRQAAEQNQHVPVDRDW
jgi:Ca-activated chloride channel family protein